MATRIYLPSSGAAAVTPTDWEFASQNSTVDTFKGAREKITSAMTSFTGSTGTTSPTTRSRVRYVCGPLAAQTISGDVEGQMRCSENNAGANATLALAVKIIQPNGNDRHVLRVPTAADNASSPFEMLTALTNRIFYTVAEQSDIPLTSGDATQGDYLVIEIGWRSATTTDRTITLSLGDDNANDLTDENTSETTALNPWIEFTANIAFLATGTSAPNLPKPTMSASGTVSHVGTMSPSLPLPTMSASGSAGAGGATVTGTIAANLLLPTSTATGSRVETGTIATSVPLPMMAATGSRVETGTMTPSLLLPTSAMTGIVNTTVTGTAAPSLPLLTASMTGTVGEVGGGGGGPVIGMGYTIGR